MPNGGTERVFKANFTWYMFFSCVVAASGGAVSLCPPSLRSAECQSLTNLRVLSFVSIVLHAACISSPSKCHVMSAQLFGWDNGVTGEAFSLTCACFQRASALHGNHCHCTDVIQAG